MKSPTSFFLNIEERARLFFERVPFIQAFLAGVGVIIFWRGIWEWLDQSGVTPLASVILGSLILGSVGVFVQTFIGNTIIIREVKQEEKNEKKAVQKMEVEVGSEEATLAGLSARLDTLIKKLDDHNHS